MPRRSGRTITLLLLSCSCVLPRARAAAPAAAATLGSGEFRVLERDVSDWQAVQRCYPEGLDSRKGAFMRQLETAAMETILADQAGIRVAERALVQEEKRVDRETKAPEILACIKTHFGEDRRRYRRVFLRPLLVQKEFSRHAGFSRKVQSEAYALSEKAAAVMGEASFAQIAGKYGLRYSSGVYSETRPEDGRAAPGGRGPWSSFEPYFIGRYLKDLEPGEIRKEPIDGDSDILHVRLISKDGPRYRFESLSAGKMDLAAYAASRPKIPCVVGDAELLSWLRGISGNPMLRFLELK